MQALGVLKILPLMHLGVASSYQRKHKMNVMYMNAPRNTYTLGNGSKVLDMMILIRVSFVKVPQENFWNRQLCYQDMEIK